MAFPLPSSISGSQPLVPFSDFYLAPLEDSAPISPGPPSPPLHKSPALQPLLPTLPCKPVDPTAPRYPAKSFTLRSLFTAQPSSSPSKSQALSTPSLPPITQGSSEFQRGPRALRRGHGLRCAGGWNLSNVCQGNSPPHPPGDGLTAEEDRAQLGLHLSGQQTATAFVPRSLNGPTPGPCWAQRVSQSALGGETNVSTSKAASAVSGRLTAPPQSSKSRPASPQATERRRQHDFIRQ